MPQVGKTSSQDAVYQDLEDGVDLTNVDDDAPAQIVNSGTSACVRFIDGNVKCWGANEDGRLGYGDTNNRGDEANEMGANLPFVNLGTNRTAKLLASSAGGAGFQCAILDNAQLKCWGVNRFGALGLGDTNTRGNAPNEMGDNLPFVDLGAGRTAKAVSLGYLHACAILDNDRVKCWGAGGFGQLGYGDTLPRGDEPNEMGDDLPYVDLGGGRTAKAISAGYTHTCAILDNDKVKCWGSNFSGDLGYGDRLFRGDAPSEMGDNLPYVDLGAGRTAKSVRARTDGSCAILDDDELKCWGNNFYGRLGLGDFEHRGDAPNEMGDSLPAVNLGVGRRAVGMYGGCAILDSGTLKCWGFNGHGELGYGDRAGRGDAPNEMGDSLPVVDLGTQRKAVDVTFTSYFTCAILDDRTVKCWGENDRGQLGYGDLRGRGANGGEMGDSLPVVQLK